MPPATCSSRPTCRSMRWPGVRAWAVARACVSTCGRRSVSLRWPTGGPTAAPDSLTEVGGRERVALLGVTGRIARAQPLLTLGAAAVREGLLVDLPAAQVLLDPVVADVPRDLQRVGEVLLVDRRHDGRLAVGPGLGRVLGPDAG